MRRRDAVVEVLQPGQTQDQRPKEEAAVQVRPDRDDDRDQPRAPGDARRRDVTSSSTTAKQAIPNSCGRRAMAGAAIRNATITSSAARPMVETPPPGDDHEAAEDDRRSARRAGSRVPSSHPAARPGVRTTWAPHCWSTQGRPAAVYVQVSTVGMARPSRISAPARSWYVRSTVDIGASNDASTGRATARNNQNRESDTAAC